MSGVNFLQQVMSDDGLVIAATLAKTLHITQRDLAEATGLSLDSVSKAARVKSRNTQARLKETVEIINRVAQWSGGVGRAFAWFRSQPIPSLGDRTAEELVKAGQAAAVKAYLARIAAGGYA